LIIWDIITYTKVYCQNK